MGNVYEKVLGPVVYVEDCSFQNCSTKRESGKIIKEYSSYFGLFDREIKVRAVSIGQNCKGLDKINEENGYTKDVVVKAETNTGIKIGATLATTALVGVIPGLLAGKVIEKIVRDTDKHIE